MTVDQGSESRESYLIVLKSMYLEVSMGHEMSKKIELKKLNKKKKKKVIIKHMIWLTIITFALWKKDCCDPSMGKI